MRQLIFISFLFVWSGFVVEESSSSHHEAVKNSAFEILKAKCNVCHVDKNPFKVFTKVNMDGFTKRINRQVFIFRRMPKGKEIKLSKKEKQTLKSWIKNLKK